MDIQDLWERALSKTEIVRPRVQPLQTFQSTQLGYIFLAESSVNVGDTAVRKGEITVEKPTLLLPPDNPQFQGFNAEGMPFNDQVTNFLLMRGVRFPSWRYDNKTFALDIFEGKLSQAVEAYKRELEKVENISTGLVIGPEDCWQFSILIFIGNTVVKSAEADIRRLMEDYRKKQP